MDSTTYSTITSSNTQSLIAAATISPCTCRNKNTAAATTSYHKSTTLSTRLINLSYILLLATILPLIYTKNIVVTAAPSHQSNTPPLPESESLVTKTAASNTLNSTAMALMELQLQTVKINSVQTTQPGVVVSTPHPEHSRALKKAWLSNRTIVCNDGTAAGFYLRKNPNSKKWIVFLEGGWHCYDKKTCRARWNRLRHLMTSTDWPETRDGK